MQESVAFRFHNQNTADPNVGPNPRRVSQDYIGQHDGSTYTLLTSENVAADRAARAADSWATEYDSAGNPLYVPGELNVGIVWDPLWEPDDGVSLDLSGLPTSLYPNPPAINVYKELDFARPSALHPGGVLAFFADGHGQFLSEGIDYLIYQHLMTPYGQRAAQVAEMNQTPTLPNLLNTVFDPGDI